MSNFNSSLNDVSYLNSIEKTVISSMLFNYEDLDDIFETIKHNMFYSPIHQEIVRVIEVLFNNDLPIDENFIVSRCDNKFKQAIEQTLIEIMTFKAITNVRAYCKDIVESFRRREIATLLNKVKKSLFEDNLNSEDILSFIDSEKDRIDNFESNSSDVKTLEELADEYDNEPSLTKIPTGIQWLDSPKCLDGGFEAPNFIFLSGEKETGKTYLATTILENMADEGYKVGFFPLEFGGKAYWKGLKTKYPHIDNKKRINCRKNIYVEANVFDIVDIVKKIKKMHKKGVKFVFIDSKLRLTHKNFKGGTLAQMLSEIFSMLGRLTVQLEMIIMIVVQMPKENYASGKVSVKDCVDADHEAKVWINIKVDEKTGLREITLGKNKQNYKRLGIKVKFDPISHNFIKVKDLIEEEENDLKQNKSKKIGSSNGVPIYDERPFVQEFKSDDDFDEDSENKNIEIPSIL